MSDTREKALVVDVDGTIAKRIETLRPDPYDMTKVLTDEPIWPIIDLANMMVEQFGLSLIIVTARENKGDCFNDTVQWLTGRGGMLPKRVFMRAHKDNRPDEVIKEEIYLNDIRPVYDVQYVLDDNDPVVDMWRRWGHTTLQVAPGWKQRTEKLCDCGGVKVSYA